MPHTHLPRSASVARLALVLPLLAFGCEIDDDDDDRDDGAGGDVADASVEGGADGATAGGGGGRDGGDAGDAAADAEGTADARADGAGLPVADGRITFRHDTFGDERFWTDELRMHEVIQAAVDPTTALAAGLKVDADALPPGILESADLTDPVTTVALIGLDAVVGLKGVVAEDGTLERLGVTCALCHSDVDDSVQTGIGHRLDGYANRDLDPGLILSLSPALQAPAFQQVLTSWGPGRYDPRFNQDGRNHPVLIPPIYGLEGVPVETYTGDGPISYWNAYVGVTQMGALGVFSDPRIGVTVIRSPDLLTPKLPVLLDYQLSLEAPPPPAGSFDPGAAARGEELFEGKAACASCHSGEHYTDGATLHAPAETGMEPVTAQRSATKLYRTTPLRALWQHPPYFHDGSAAALSDVVEHYDGVRHLNLSDAEKQDLVEFLKSL